MESDSKRDRGEKGVKERTKILNHMIAKTDRTDNELWLPLWMHSYDTAKMTYVFQSNISEGVKINP